MAKIVNSPNCTDIKSMTTQTTRDAIDTDLRLDDLELIVLLKKRKSVFLPNILKVYDLVKELLNTAMAQQKAISS